jgi:hypothetical protein
LPYNKVCGKDSFRAEEYKREIAGFDLSRARDNRDCSGDRDYSIASGKYGAILAENFENALRFARKISKPTHSAEAIRTGGIAMRETPIFLWLGFRGVYGNRELPPAARVRRDQEFAAIKGADFERV